MKVTAAALIAAAAIAPAVAQSYYAEDSLVTREDYNDVDDLLARDYDLELEERDFYDNEDDLFERDPFFGLNHLKRLLRHKKTLQPQQDSSDAPVEAREFDDEDLFTRELEEMFERDPFLGLGKLRSWWKNRKAAKQQQQQDSYGADAQAREFDDEELYTREFEDEIEAREPEAEYEEVLTRYYDDLYERELASAEAELAERDFEDEEAELAARDFEGEDAELVAREPGIFDWFKNLFHKKKPEDTKAKEQKADAPADAEAREFDEIDELD